MSDFKPKLHADILKDMVDWVISHTNKITDFNDGSINKSILDAVSIALEEVYFGIMLGWTSAMRVALQNSLSFGKKSGQKSTGNIVFSRSTLATQDYFISTGTIVATADGIRFITTQDGYILIGNTYSGNISIEAEEEGISGNVESNTIIQLVSMPIGIETVDNSASTSNGVDEESDDDYAVRFQYYLQGLTKTTPPGIQGGAMEVAGVHEAKLRRILLGILNLYIDDGSGGANQALLDSVINKIEGDGTLNNPGYRPAGVLINYASAIKVVFNPTITIYYNSDEDPDTLKPIVEQDVSNYINKLKIGEDVILSKITDIIMSVIGVEDVVISIPSSNVLIDVDAGEVARYGTGTYNMVLY